MNLLKNFQHFTGSMPQPRSVLYKEYGPLPPVAWHMDALAHTKHTPDIGKLEQKLTHLLFAYDTFHDSLTDYNIFTFTQHRYKMWKQDLGKYSHFVPINVPHEYKDLVDRPVWADPNPGIEKVALAKRIRGTINLVSTDTIISLDKDMDNTVRYNRVRVPLLYPYRTVIKFKNQRPQDNNNVGTLWAWMYQARSEFWEQMIDDPLCLGQFRAARLTRPKSLWVDDFYTNDL